MVPMHPFHAHDDWDESWADPGSFYAPIQPWDLMEPMGPFPPWESWEEEPLPVEVIIDMAFEVVDDHVLTERQKKIRVLEAARRCFEWMSGIQGGGILVGWSQPPRPADVVVSFDPRASKRDQARAVLYDYYHDDPLRYWSDNEAVKRCFIGGSDPRKENHDVLLLVAAYEDKNHPIWKCRGDKMTWADMDKAVQQAIAHRRKLGPLPKSTYDTRFTVIYYYDNDKMKRITYPGPSIVPALNPNNNSWWSWGGGDQSDAGKAAGLDDVHTRETDDPKKIEVERANPGWVTEQQKQVLKKKYPWISDMKSGSAGDWSSEGFTYDKDWVGKGIWGALTGAVMAVITAIGSVVSLGIAAAPLGALSALAVAAVNAADTALHAGDFGAALAQLGPALIQAAVSAVGQGAGAAGFNIPPAALKALGATVSVIAKDVAAAQQKKGNDLSSLWTDIAQKAKNYGKIGEDEAEAIAHLISGKSPTVGHVFIQGFLAGKYLDQANAAGLMKILQAYMQFIDPGIINIALLGMGMGMVSRNQNQSQGGVKASMPARTKAPTRASHAAKGDFEIEIGFQREPISDLMAFVRGVLAPRYGLRAGGHAVGSSCPEGYEAVSSGSGTICAYRRKAVCLSGHEDESGRFVCTRHDYPECPRGMAQLPGKPENWCFEVGPSLSGGDFDFVGDATPPPPRDFGPLSRGCATGSWWDPFQQTCRPVEPLPQPSPRVGSW